MNISHDVGVAMKYIVHLCLIENQLKTGNFFQSKKQNQTLILGNTIYCFSYSVQNKNNDPFVKLKKSCNLLTLTNNI